MPYNIKKCALVSHKEWVSDLKHHFKRKRDNIENSEKEENFHDEFEKILGKICTNKDDYRNNIKRILDLINNQQDYDLSQFQRLCLKQMIKCMAKIICENPPAHILSRLLEKYNMAMSKTRLVFLGTSRRGGKTDIMTMLVAAMMIVCRHCKLLYYSIQETTCILACTTVASWICRWGYSDIIISKNATKIVLKGQDENDTRSCTFLTGNSPNVNIIHYIYIYIFY
jgi:hypothetical protein